MRSRRGSAPLGPIGSPELEGRWVPGISLSCSGNHARGQGVEAGGLCGRDGRGSGAQNKGGTTKAGGDGAAGLVIIECR